MIIVTCEYCQIVNNEIQSHKIYEDEKIIAIVPNASSCVGEVIIIPKEHYQIIEQVPDELIEHISIFTRKLSDICFEILSGQGTNILVQNGIPGGQESPHFSVRIFPRRDGDGLDFKWEGNQAKPEDLDSAMNILKDETKNIFVSVIETKKQKEPINNTRPSEVKEDPGEINYQLDSLRRIP